jgi:hypothetical protein
MKKLWIAPALFLIACGPEKPKLDLGEDTGKTLDAVGAAGGAWREVQVVESAHPYTNDFDRTFRVNGSAGATEMRVVLTRFELEAGYDFLTVQGVGTSPTRLTGTRTGEEVVVAGNAVELRIQTDYSVTKWGFRATVFEREACACITLYKPVCGVDGNTYGNACEAGCSGVAIAYQSACNGNPWFPVSRAVDSPHPYTDDLDQSWTVAEGGARFIRLHFTRLDLERGYDFLTVADRAGNIVARYTGADTDVTTPAIAGDTAVIRLVTDESVTRFGFSMDRYEVIGGCVSDADCGQGQVCNTNIVCIRAPCFSICEPAGGGYTDVTMTELEQNGAAWSGRAVRVVAEPQAHGAACTRRACTQANPCCNTCSAGLQVGNGIMLRDGNDQSLGCQGNECNWQSTCNPFPASGAGPYELLGTFMSDAQGPRLVIADFAAADCQRGGCSGQACSNGAGLVTTCEWRPEYACYQAASCEAQTDGHCGWTPTPELQMCLDGARAERYIAADVPVAIPDANTTGARSRIQVTSAGNVSRLLVSVNISHTYKGDLVVDLVAPTGERFNLHNGTGGSANDVIFTDLEVSASGLAKAGTWSLHAVDRYRRDVGTIAGFELAFR